MYEARCQRTGSDYTTSITDAIVACTAKRSHIGLDSLSGFTIASAPDEIAAAIALKLDLAFALIATASITWATTASTTSAATASMEEVAANTASTAIIISIEELVAVAAIRIAAIVIVGSIIDHKVTTNSNTMVSLA